MQYILIIGVALLLYTIQQTYYKRHWKDDLSVTISYSQKQANIGDSITLTEQISNKKFLPLPVLYVKFYASKTFIFEEKENLTISDHNYRNDIFSILGNQQITRNHQFKATQRGYFPINSIDLVSSDLFMRNSYATQFENQTGLYIYPKPINTTYSLQITSTLLGILEQKNWLEDPLSFRSIREYNTQDGMRHINWKASAKTGTLMVNNYFDTQKSEAVLLLNTNTNRIEHSDDLLEYLVRIAATICQQLIYNGAAIRLAINTGETEDVDTIMTPLGVGEEHFHSLMRTLSKLDFHKSQSDFLEFFKERNNLFNQKDTNTVYIILSNYRKQELLDFYQRKKQQGHSLLFICPEYKEYFDASAELHFWEVLPDGI